MPIFSDPIFISAVTTISVAVLCVGVYNYGHRRGYTKCMNNLRDNARKRQARHKYVKDIHVVNPVEPSTHYTEAESVRIVATHAPRSESKNI